MKKMKSVYLNVIYDDGTLEQIQIKNKLDGTAKLEDIFGNSEKSNNDTQILQCSQKLLQIITVIKQTGKFMEQGFEIETISDKALGKLINSVYRTVAEDFGVAPQTVADKTLRQLGLKKEEFVLLVKDFYIKHKEKCDLKETELYKKIADTCGENLEDMVYLKNFAENI